MFEKGVVLFHDTRSNHLCINYANMLTLYGDKSWYQGSKNISMIFKYLVSWVKKTSLTKKVATFKNCRFPFKNFFDENNIAKFAVDMWRNCSNRLCQSTFSVLFLFHLYITKFVNSLLNYLQNISLQNF